MSWNFKLKCRDSELDTKLKEVIRNQGAAKDNPASQLALRRIQVHGLEAIQNAPKDSEITVMSYGHYGSNGEGEHTVMITVLCAEAVALNERLAQEGSNRREANEVQQPNEYPQSGASYVPVGDVTASATPIPQVSGVDQDAPQ